MVFHANATQIRRKQKNIDKVKGRKGTFAPDLRETLALSLRHLIQLLNLSHIYLKDA